MEVPAAHSAGCADRAARHDADARRGHALAGARRADRRWRRCCTIRHGRLPPGNGDATELLPRRAWHAYAYGAGTLDGAAACIGRAGCLEPLAPGSSFCWGPELQGSTSPSSSWSATTGRAGRDQSEVRRTTHPPTLARAPATPPAPCTDLAPSRRLAPPTRRLARLASTSPPCALVCAGAQLLLFPTPSLAAVAAATSLPATALTTPPAKPSPSPPPSSPPPYSLTTARRALAAAVAADCSPPPMTTTTTTCCRLRRHHLPRRHRPHHRQPSPCHRHHHRRFPPPSWPPA